MYECILRYVNISNLLINVFNLIVLMYVMNFYINLKIDYLLCVVENKVFGTLCSYKIEKMLSYS